MPFFKKLFAERRVVQTRPTDIHEEIESGFREGTAEKPGTVHHRGTGARHAITVRLDSRDILIHNRKPGEAAELRESRQA